MYSGIILGKFWICSLIVDLFWAYSGLALCLLWPCFGFFSHSHATIAAAQISGIASSGAALDLKDRLGSVAVTRHRQPTRLVHPCCEALFALPQHARPLQARNPAIGHRKASKEQEEWLAGGGYGDQMDGLLGGVSLAAQVQREIVRRAVGDD